MSSSLQVISSCRQQWRRWCLLPLVFMLIAVTQAEPRVALVIGNGQYQNAPVLPNPVNDAKAVAVALQRLGFKVLQGMDLVKRQRKLTPWRQRKLTSQ